MLTHASVTTMLPVIDMARARAFYERLGFIKKTEDRLHILEQDQFKQFLGGNT